MSHYASIEIKALVNNETQLVEALKEYFGEDGVEVHNEPAALAMWDGTDATTNKNSFGNAPKCHIIVRRATQAKAGGGSLVNDLGFLRKADGTYELYIDESGWPTDKRQKVFQNYASLVATKKLKAQGYIVKKEIIKDNIKLTAIKFT